MFLITSLLQASIQTVPKELKNKSMLCIPLVHNKGVSCTVQTVETGMQTGKMLLMLSQPLRPVQLSAAFVFVFLNMLLILTNINQSCHHLTKNVCSVNMYHDLRSNMHRRHLSCLSFSVILSQF